jgi:hypothetical protein
MIEKLMFNASHGDGFKKTQELIDTVNRLEDAMNDLEAVVHEGPNDFMSDLDDEDDEFTCACDDDDDRPWKETDPFVERLHHLSTSQLEHLLEEAEWILDGRHRQGQEYVCPECRAKAEAEGDDGYCEQCNDYHDAPDDDDETVTKKVQDVVDDVRRERKESAQRLEDCLRDIKEGRDTSKKGSDLKSVDTSDGLFSQFAAYVTKHPDQRFFQAVRNFSGYNFILGSMALDADDYSQLEDTFNLKTKGPKKGGA